MILKALYDLAHDEELMGDPDFEWKPVTFLVKVGPQGRLLGIESTRQIPPDQIDRKKPKAVAKSFEVPREPGRTSGDRAFFLFDKADYALGLDPDEKWPAEKVAKRFALFRQRVRDCLDATGDEGVAAVATLLDDLASGRQQVEVPDDCAGNDLFTFIAYPETRLVTQREKVRAYWKELRAESAGEGNNTRCLVTGREDSPADKHTVLKYVPGAVTSGVPLVSFNASAFESYGLEGNENAPISRDAAEAFATALQRLLHPAPPDPAGSGSPLSKRHLRLSADTVVGYWTAGNDAFVDVLTDLLEGNLGQVAELYQSIWYGRMPQIDNPSAFYALTLSGAQGRVIVRGWIESTVAEAQRHLARHFADLAIVRNTPKPKNRELPSQLPLRVLLQSLAAPGKSESVPPAMASQLIEAALHGLPYPIAILQRAIQRTRAEIGRDAWGDLERRDARAALIKAVFNRRRRHNDTATQEVKREMDPENTHPGYLLGRMMAVIERLQQLALKDVNTTVVDRYFSAASATPRAVFTRLLRGARHHARKALDDDKTKGFARSLENQLDAIAATFDPKNNGFPAHLNLEEQGLFVLGYHQQRHHLWQKKRPDRVPITEVSDDDTDDPTAI